MTKGVSGKRARSAILQPAPPTASEHRDGFAEAPQESFDVFLAETGDARVRTILDTARIAGLLEQKTARISGRISPSLVDRAKRLTGIESNTDLIEFALANVALDDPFPAAFRQARGTIDPSLKLGF